MPSFYEDHLVDLVKKGYIVFFPDFQRSCYPNTPPNAPTPSLPSLAHLQRWQSVASKLPPLSAKASLSIDDIYPILSDVYERGDAGLGRGLSEFSAEEFRRVVRSLVVIILLLTVVSWFRREYGKNLIHLLSTVALSLVHRPTEWLANAIALTEDAWEYLSQQERYSHWNQETLDTFAFGHSLGGLIALSLPWYLKENSPNNQFFPKQIVTADPAASTEMGIPKFAIWLLKLFGVPFTEDPILIQNTGKSLTGPVAILHGGADKLVPPRQWVDASGGKRSNYEAIASQNKGIYFSYSNPGARPPLVAFHNQAVTCTEYYGDGLFKNFGGVKKGPNAYNADYVYPGVDLIFQGDATPEDILQHINPRDFQVKTTPPDNSSKLLKRLAWIVGISLLIGVSYWMWNTVG